MVGAVAGGLVGAAALVGVSPASGQTRRTAVAAPTPTPARPGKPTSVVAVGDSITQSTGTGALAQENPKNSWATGWEVSSVAARLGVPTSRRYNLSTNGDRMSDFAPQIQNGKSGGSGDVSPAPADTGLVLVEFGGNDLCRSSVDDMTSVETYRSQFKAGLDRVKVQAPDALIQVMSVPDIYNLWYIRGAPQNATYHPEPESGQAGGLNGARLYWSIDIFGAAFPCQSLLDKADSYAPADRDRRAAVRARTKAYNDVLATECAKVLRCRFDDQQLFDLTSNRVTPPDGPLLPQAQWNFTDLDISRNTASLCPIPGLVGGGCGDHFHPSKQGQGKIADVAALAGRDWTDTTFPVAGAAVLPSDRPDGVHRWSATVRFSGADARGLRGQEVRVHRPDGSVSSWAPHLGVAPDLTIADLGTSYVEVRSLDVNGNLSASTVVPVVVEGATLPSAPTAPSVTAGGAGLTVAWSAPDDGASALTGYQVRAYVGAPTAKPQSPVAATGTSMLDPAPPPAALVRYSVAARNAVGLGPESPLSAPTIAPFATIADFVRQQHRDFSGSLPSEDQVTAEAAELEAGALTPGAYVDLRRRTTWFDGAYGPATRLYRAYFLRNPDPSGLDFWANRRRNGTTLSRISLQFAASSEFARRYGALTDAEFIDQVYRNVFERDPDPSGRAFYLARLQAKTWNRGQVVLQFSESGEYQRKTAVLVTAIELARGMTGRAPSASLVDELVAAHGDGGVDAMVAVLIATPAYRVRVL